MNINRARRATQRTTVLLGDAQAINRGRITARLFNRVIGRLASALLRGVWR